MNARHSVLAAFAVLALAASASTGCAATSHPVTASPLGTTARAASLEAVVDEPGPLTVETVVGADWEVPLSGLLNLDHPEAKRAGLVDRDEPIQVAFHAVQHPVHGTFLIDTGAERAFFDRPDRALVTGIVARVAHTDKMKRGTDTRTWVEQHPHVEGVFLTHLHLDHVTGLRDVPDSTRVFVGPGDATSSGIDHVVLRPIFDRALEAKPPLAEWRFERDPDGVFDGVLDVFGDGSFWALHVPGHTPGSTAYVARTTNGPILFTGDACHTIWGWEHGVEPGTFSSDRPKSADSLERLRRFASRHPSMVVRVGHQLR